MLKEHMKNSTAAIDKTSVKRYITLIDTCPIESRGATGYCFYVNIISHRFVL